MKEDLYNRILSSVRSKNAQDIHLHEPQFDQTDKDFLSQCIDSGFVSSIGDFVNDFEAALKNYTSVEGGAVLCSNGTAALHLCLIAAEVKPLDEVLIPSLTFVATGNACLYQGATPHFVDVCPQSLSVDPIKLRNYLESHSKIKDGKCINLKTGQKIAALIVMHCFGHIGDFDALKQVCSDFHIKLIEDAAESLGSLYKNKQSGSLADFSAISFNGNKVITTGGGGVFLTNNPDIAKKIKHISTTSKVPHPYKFIHDQIGFNYRMPNLNAALGMAQFKKLPLYLKKKRQLAASYTASFETCDYARFVEEPKNCKSNYWLNFIYLERDLNLDQIITFLHKKKVFVRPIWTPLHKLEHFKKSPKSRLSTTETLEKRILCLPSSPFLA